MTTHETRWITFDCYGTLIDWRTGMEDAMRQVSPTRVDELLAAYHQHEHTVQNAAPAPSYRHVLTESMRRATLDLGIDVPPHMATVLADTLSTWPVFPETRDALRALHREGWSIGILSNVDDNMIAPTLNLLGESIDEVVTSEQVKSYKPNTRHFEEFSRRTGATTSTWIHVACSWFHDVVPSKTMGVPAVFINREREVRDTSGATAVRDDLVDLAEVVAGIYNTEQ